MRHARGMAELAGAHTPRLNHAFGGLSPWHKRAAADLSGQDNLMPNRGLKRWKCSICSREFAKRNQWHSCLARPVEAHFRGKDPALREIYHRLIVRLRELGPLRVDAVKSSINLASRYHFGGLTVRQDHVRLGFLADRAIQDKRVVRRMRLGPMRVGHSVLLRRPSDVDAKLMGWLKRAYVMQARDGS